MNVIHSCPIVYINIYSTVGTSMLSNVLSAHLIREPLPLRSQLPGNTQQMQTRDFRSLDLTQRSYLGGLPDLLTCKALLDPGSALLRSLCGHSKIISC